MRPLGGGAGGGIKSIQQGVFTDAGGSSDATIAVASVDPEKCLFVCHVAPYGGDLTTPATVELTNGTTITILKNGTTRRPVVEWLLIEFE